MNTAFLADLARQTSGLHEDGLFKAERRIVSQQDAVITLDDGSEVMNFCANNYLGLANNTDLIDTARAAVEKYGYGMASVRFICGTQSVHTELEAAISKFLHTEDTILYSSCFDANGGLFETILSEEDAVISDSLNHASIIDGIRLSKARRFRYANNDMADLAAQLAAASNARYKLIATDGVFSMDGIVANLPGICDLAEEHDALVMVDDSHAVGFVGPNGGGTPDYWGVQDRVDIVTGTLGKALGGASGGYTSGRKEIIAWLRQRSRPYLFSNTLAPVIAATTLRALEMLDGSADLRERLIENSQYFRDKMTAAGFELAGEGHPIIPVMLGDAQLASEMADRLLSRGIYVIGFSFPVVPKGAARIRTQMSAAHTKDQLDQAIAAFIEVGRELGVIDR
ncbi:MAG: glycine C-acetyltransferase [bacterium]|nr:glycine C-acetyltransferase [bacterium]